MTTTKPDETTPDGWIVYLKADGSRWTRLGAQLVPLATYIGTCRYGHTVRQEMIATKREWLRECTDCLGDPAIVAERDAFMAQHPQGYFPLRVALARIRGKLSTRHECNDQCRDARGPVCLCSCAGEQHGANWSMVLA